VTVGQKRRRLSRSAEFDRVYRHGRSAASGNLILYGFPRPADSASPADAEDGSRLGVAVGRRVGGAVVRNRVKRLLREAFWSLPESIPADHDYVIVARADARALAERDGLDGLRRELEQLMAELTAGQKPERAGDG
jgi:ribonuclease P protein component